MKKELKDKTLYELNPSQEVVKMQLLFSLDKRVINILTSATTDEKFDFDLIKKAVNICIERNDSLRLRFVKTGFNKLMQYFEENVEQQEIPCYDFATKEEQDEFIKSEQKKPIKYLKGKVIEVSLINTYDNKTMVFVKVCHLIIDTYGIIIFFKDLFEVYDALKNKTELPAPLNKFEDIVKKDLVKKHDKEAYEKNREFFLEYFKNREEPYYAGIHGLTTKIAKKMYPNHLMKMFLICNNKTAGYERDIDKNLTDKIITYCTNNKISPASFMFFASSLTQAKLNNDTPNMLQIELCNCRPTAFERNCAGTKVQSLGCYTHFDYDKTIKENFDTFCVNQNTFYRHVGFSDVEFQALTHKVWKSSQIQTYYGMLFSFIPMPKPNGVNIQVYSNGKFALPCYFAILFDTNGGGMKIVYECQTKLTNEQHVNTFHNNYISIINQIIDNDSKKLSEVEVTKEK